MANRQIPETMQAMVLEHPQQPLVHKTVKTPVPGPGQVLIKVIACGVCRTDLHILDGELDQPKLPLIQGHEIVGMVIKTGDVDGISGADRPGSVDGPRGADRAGSPNRPRATDRPGSPNRPTRLREGDLVGIPWLGFTCGKCKYCLRKQENLCENALFTGYTMDGGFAEYTVAFESYCFPLSREYATAAGAPLLCAGLIGYRSYRMLPEDAQNIGLYGFGAAAHILIQVAKHEGKNVYAFTNKGDLEGQAFAKDLGATWAGDSLTTPPVKLDGAILFAPVGSLVPKALTDLDKGGVVVCGGIHMSDIPSFPYEVLWEERVIRSVANLTREDGFSFLKLAPGVPVRAEIQTFPLTQANEALEKIRKGGLKGAAVLVM
jgi:propanol-preferring alcohol dehydrogenase